MRLLCGIGLLALVGCGGQSTPPPVYVGHVATLSGAGKEEGEQASRGIRLAVQEQNKGAAEDNSRPVIVRHTDTRGNLEAFEAEAVRLVTVNRVLGLLGGTNGDEIARMDRAQVPLVSPFGMRLRNQGELVFLTGLSPAFQGQVLARYAGEKAGPVQVVILADERREDALALADAFARAFPKSVKDAKKQIPRPITWRYGKEKDSMPDLSKRLVAEKPSAILVAGSSADLLQLRKDFPPSALALFGGDNPPRSMLDSADSDGVVLAVPFVADADTPLAKEFVANYRKAFNEDPDNSAALAYDGARLLFEAIKKSQPQPGNDKIAKELAKIKDFPGLTGPLSFSEDRHLRRPAFLVRVEKGRLQTLKRIGADE
ncbi:MAG TPA: ABC transporter substrate-binding protein [Gemmataceae bacterium]|nr:ABC transporter substrate-binding protein [Gemmataceae bacterium]